MTHDIDITTDLVCVWCYVGLHRLERALEARPTVNARLTFHPYELNPDMPPEGMDRAAFVAAKFGAGQWKAMEARLRATASADGLPLDYSRITRRPNSRLAHIVMSRAMETGHARALHRAITSAYFAEGRDIGQRDVLSSIAITAGMDPKDIDDAVDDPQRASAVSTRAQSARQNGIEGVPFFVLNKRYALSGAQPTSDWLEVIDTLKTTKPSMA